MSRRMELTGMTFGRLTVLGFNGITETKKVSTWLCQCACGNMRIARGSNLKSGITKSCGCLKTEVNKSRSHHGMSKTRTFRIWGGMLNRCHNKNSPLYENYGGRGIAVCERWKSFNNFLADMGEVPKGLSIERLDNNANYCPENCVWADVKVQGRNRRTNRFITFNGQKQCLKAWSEQLGISHMALSSRLKIWPIDRALTEKREVNRRSNKRVNELETRNG